jgi:uncharacterized protein (TIGR02466 family)
MKEKIENNKLSHFVFPVLIKQIKNFLNKEECNEIVFQLKKNKLKNHNALTKNKGFSSHSVESNIIEKLNKNIQLKLNQEIKEYTNEYSFKNLIISNSWFNIEKKGCILENHTHPMSVVSGALYLKTDELSNKIYFFNPNPFIGFSEFEKNNFINYEYIYLNVEIGSVLLFPSWLKHGSNFKKNNSKERICLSFNTKYDLKRN